MRNMVFLATVLVAGLSFAQNVQPADGENGATKKFTPEQLAARDLRVLKKTGGLLDIPAKGPIPVLLDTRAAGDASTVKEVARVYRLAAKMEISAEAVKREGKSSYAFGKASLDSNKALLAVVVAEDGNDMPALSVYPEERVGVVNADALKADGDPSRTELRVNKEIWRAIGFISGMGFSQMEKDIMQPMYTLKDLDANEYPFIQPMNMTKMQRMGNYFGVVRKKRIPYRIAVREGWASAPTNEYQRAVWVEEKAQMTNAPAKAIAK